MTVATTTNRVQTAGNGITTSFPTTGFIFFEETELEVYLVDTTADPETETLQTLTTHYTVTGGDGATGTVEMITPPSATEELLIVRVLPLTQASDLVNNDISDAEVIEDIADRGTMVTQQLQEQLDRAIKLPVSSDNSDLSIPDPVANEYLRWNAAADALENAEIVDLDALGLPVAVADGGTGAITAAAARTNLGAANVAGDTFTGPVDVDDTLDVTGALTADSTLEVAGAITSTKGHTFAVGDMIASYAATRTGFLLMYGQTVGSASSGADDAHADYADIFAFLWDNLADAQCPVSTGRGASAAADFAADKTITMIDRRGTVGLGADNMGGSSANVVTDTEADTLGDTAGAATNTLTTTELPAHSHAPSGGGSFLDSSGGFTVMGSGGSTVGTSATTTSTGSGAAYSIMNPYVTENVFIRY